MRLTLAAITVAAALTSGLAVAQEPMAPAQPPAAGELAPINATEDNSALIGKTVETTDGAEVGQVQEIQSDGYVVVSGGMLTGPVNIPVSLLGLNEADDVLVLLLTETELRSQLPN